MLEINRSSYPGLRAAVETGGNDSLLMRLKSDGRATVSHLVMPLEIRTNVGYELTIETLFVQGCLPEITTSINSIRASGAAVACKAVDNSKQWGPAVLLRTGGAATILAGPRVSLAGGLASPANALLVNLNMDLNEQAKGCGWQALFRISLEHSTH